MRVTSTINPPEAQFAVRNRFLCFLLHAGRFCLTGKSVLMRSELTGESNQFSYLKVLLLHLKVFDDSMSLFLPRYSSDLEFTR